MAHKKVGVYRKYLEPVPVDVDLCRFIVGPASAQKQLAQEADLLLGGPLVFQPG